MKCFQNLLFSFVIFAVCRASLSQSSALRNRLSNLSRKLSNLSQELDEIAGEVEYLEPGTGRLGAQTWDMLHALCREIGDLTGEDSPTESGNEGEGGDVGAGGAGEAGGWDGYVHGNQSVEDVGDGGGGWDDYVRGHHSVKNYVHHLNFMNSTKTLPVDIVEELSVIHVIPEWELMDKSQMFIVTLELVCTATGYPLPNVTFTLVYDNGSYDNFVEPDSVEELGDKIRVTKRLTFKSSVPWRDNDDDLLSAFCMAKRPDDYLWLKSGYDIFEYEVPDYFSPDYI